MNDLAYFVFILAVFIIGYGVALQAVRFPNTTPWQALKGVVNKPYWQMYGELFIEDLFEDPKNCATGNLKCGIPGEDVCSTKYSKWVAPIFLAMYMMFTNILLLNLLIAIFNYTFEKVQDDSDKVWKFQRYDLIQEYHSRPAFAPPLILISHIRNGFLWILEKCRCCHFTPSEGSLIKLKLSPDEKEALSRWEFTATESYIYHSHQLEAEKLDERVKEIQERVSYVSGELHDVVGGEVGRDSGTSNTESFRRMGSVQASGLEGRMATLELQIQQLTERMVQQNDKQASMIMEAISKMSSCLSPARDILLPIHIKARSSPYPRSDVIRANVSDDKVYWQIQYADYNPVEYTSEVVLARPVWADPNIKEMSQKLPFNDYDIKRTIERRSYHGKFDIVDGLPRNPVGRTGMTGRGLLGKWGPNHAADPIITRWKAEENSILEFVSIKRRDCGQWAIPGGMVDPGETVEDTLKREFMEEALSLLEISEEKAKELEVKMDTLLLKKHEIYKGYVDDPRNTDNAWIETFACNFHDETGDFFGDLELKAGSDAEEVQWKPISNAAPLYASHLEILKKVAQLHDASF